MPAMSVAPLGGDELLFANKLYRLWFGAPAGGHLRLVAQAGVAPSPVPREASDDVDAFAGLPTNLLPDSGSRKRRGLHRNAWASGWRCAPAT